MTDSTISGRIRPWALLAAPLLVAMAVIHAVEVPHYLHRHPVMGGLFVANVCAGIALGAAVLSGRRLVWVLTALVAAATAVGFILSRSTGLPGYRDHSWTEYYGGVPLGPLSLAVEGILTLLAVAVLGVLSGMEGARRDRAAASSSAADTARAARESS
jgi:uncharacterized membrane protein